MERACGWRRVESGQSGGKERRDRDKNGEEQKEGGLGAGWS